VAHLKETGSQPSVNSNMIGHLGQFFSSEAPREGSGTAEMELVSSHVNH
jgi:hypothetical protein